MSKIIGIVSGKGGVGKTVSAVNLGLALHQFGEDTIVVDADTSASNLGMHLGFYSFPNSLQNVLTGDIDADRATYMHHTGLRVIPSAIDLNSLDASVSKLRIALKSLPNKYVIVDAPPGLDEDSRAVLDACDDVIIVTNAEIPAVTNAVKVARVAQDMKKNLLGVVVNRAQGTVWELTPQEVEMMCEAPIIGTIPEDVNIKKSIFEKTPVVAQNPYSASSIEYKRLAARLIGKTYEPPKFMGIKKLLGML
ncbi:MAG: cell division ATPase MinD [Candidatus Aenigmarchaeota archaeon]|nr:cell division ATPase MinD [Candidatus Aenigmarchaeota archaeon]